MSPWTELAGFCDHIYLKLTPRNQDKRDYQKDKASIQNQCVDLLQQHSEENWEFIVKNFAGDKNIDTADNFCYYLSNKWENTPREVLNKYKNFNTEFVNLLPEIIGKKVEQDLLKINEFLDLLEQINGSSEKSFFFLKTLAEFLPEKAQPILAESKGYEQLIYWGASKFLKDFADDLLIEFQITRQDIQQQTAQNLVRELGETKEKLQQQIDWLERENQELKETIENLRLESFQEAVIQFAQILQNQSQPTLDLIYRLHQRLKDLEKTEDNLCLTRRESLSVLILLENLLAGLRSVKLEYFPQNTQKTFEISGEELTEYSYVEGSPFAEVTDSKEVRCINPGWRVGETIITPARVGEISQNKGVENE
jgi:hypothetical protein